MIYYDGSTIESIRIEHTLGSKFVKPVENRRFRTKLFTPTFVFFLYNVFTFVQKDLCVCFYFKNRTGFDLFTLTVFCMQYLCILESFSGIVRRSRLDWMVHRIPFDHPVVEISTAYYFRWKVSIEKKAIQSCMVRLFGVAVARDLFFRSLLSLSYCCSIVLFCRQN